MPDGLDFLPDPNNLKSIAPVDDTADNSVSFLPEIQNLKSLAPAPGTNIFPDSGEAPYSFLQDNPVGQSIGRIARRTIGNLSPVAQFDDLIYGAGTIKNAIQNYPEEYDKANEYDMPLSLSTAIKAGLNSYLEASVRDVPDDQKEAAKAKALASITGIAGGTAMGGPLGGLAVGTISPFVTDQIMQLLGMSEDKPIQDDAEELASNAATAGVYNPLYRLRSTIIGGTAERAASKLGIAESKISRQQDPNMLRARAIARGANDFDVRANKAQEIASGKPIEVQGSAQNPVNSGSVDIDANHPINKGIAFDEDGNPYYLNNEAAAPPATTGETGVKPITDVATNDPEVQGAGTRRISGPEIDDADVIGNITIPLKDSAVSGPKTIKLNEALPEIEEVFNIKRPRGDVYPQGRSEFDLYATNVRNQKKIQSGEIDKAIDEVPDSVKFKNRDIYGSLFQKIESGFSDREIKPARDVAINEVMRAAERDLSPVEAKAFKKVFKRLRLDEGGGYSLNVHVTPEMKAIYINLRDKLLDYGHSARDVKQLKTEFDKASNWKGATDSEAVGRTQAYREIANSVRGQLATTIAKANPALGERYNAANRKYTVLTTVEPLIDKTARIASQKGRDWMVGMNPADTNFDLPVISSVLRKIKAATYPQIYSPEAMMKAADPGPFNYSTRYATPNILARGAAPVLGTAAKATGLVGEGLEQLSTPAGSAALATHLANSRENREAGEDDRSWINKLKEGWDSMKSFFSPADANAQDMDEFELQQRMAAPVARSTAAVTDNMGQSIFLKKLETVAAQPMMPQEPAEASAQRASGMVQDAQTILASGDQNKIAQLMVSINKMFPGQIFAPGRFESEWDGKLYDMEERMNYSAELREKINSGQISASQAALQISSLNDPSDGRLLF